MDALTILDRKRRGGRLGREELAFMVGGYQRGEIPDYQMAALLMAVAIHELDVDEASHLTAVLVASGRRLDLSGVPGPVLTRRSTGGAGEKLDLIVAPLVAALGVAFPVIAVPGIVGHTEGSAEKLAVIPGLRTELAEPELVAVLREVGTVVARQPAGIVAVDHALFELRRLTASLKTTGLTTCSILSKKFAEGADGLVLDVKTGDPRAGMRPLLEAEGMARFMVEVGRRFGRRMVALVTELSQPLGRGIGLLPELREVLLTLQGQGPDDVTELAIETAAQAVALAGRVAEIGQARDLAARALKDGSALARFRAMVAHQGGERRVVDDPGLLGVAPVRELLRAEADGVVSAIGIDAVERATLLLGAGREAAVARVDPRAGLMLHGKVGDAVRRGEPLAEVHAESSERAALGLVALRDAYVISHDRPAPRPLVHRVVQ